jgi:hypothetical protein
MSTNFARNARLLWIVFATPKTNIMPVFVGAPGGGKSALFETVARSLDAFYLDLAPAQMGPEDFAGWPTPTADGLRFEMMRSLRDANAAPRAIVNLDELSNVPRATQAGMLRFIHTRRCGDYALNDSVRIGGAMNPSESATDAQEIALPMANRIAWLPWAKVTAKEHVAFMLNGGAASDLELPESLDANAYDAAYRDLTAIYAAFMERRGVLEEDPIRDPAILSRVPLAYATPRSWEAFIRVAATCRVLGDIDAMKTLGEGIVGPAQSLEFVAFYLDADLPSPEAWLVDPAVFTHDPKRPDRTFAATTALALAAVDKTRCADMTDKERAARWNAAWAALDAVLKTGADKTVVALAGQTLALNKPKGALLASVQKLIVEDLAPVIGAAGFAAVR